MLFLQEEMAPAFAAINAVSFYNKTIQASATKLVSEAVLDVIDEVKKIEAIDGGSKIKVLEKLREVNFSVMFSDDVLNLTKVEDIYDELHINGSEPLVKMYIAIKKHSRKIDLENKLSWRKTITDMERETQIKYFSGSNTLRNRF